MSQKKDDLPAMPFYVGDWLKAPDIQCLSHELKGIWFEMLCFMWESKERGVILYSKEELSRLLRLPEDLLEQKLKQLESKDIYSVREHDGAIYCRRMVRDQEIREIRTIAGQKGGRRTFAKHFAVAKAKAKCENETEYETETITKAVIKTTKTFTIPSVTEVQEYCKERKNGVNAQKWHDFYSSKDWMIGKNKMKDWKASVRTWEDKDKKIGEHGNNENRDVWERKADKACSNCRGSGAVYAPGSGRYSKCGCVRL